MSQIELNEREEFTPSQIEKFKADPEFYLKFIKAIEVEVNGNFPIVSPLSPSERAQLTLSVLM